MPKFPDTKIAGSLEIDGPVFDYVVSIASFLHNFGRDLANCFDVNFIQILGGSIVG